MSRKDVIMTLLDELEDIATWLKHLGRRGVEAGERIERIEVLSDRYRKDYPAP